MSSRKSNGHYRNLKGNSKHYMEGLYIKCKINGFGNKNRKMGNECCYGDTFVLFSTGRKDDR
ncbi:hypothetical protein [Leptospira alexanderi]|uniref:hypothetical protein n=1 Tax=Leptospira alexanderi TaxID=100053 RepID=UPI00099109B5|nr:hypothetical protein [Leptospira alexanderi]